MTDDERETGSAAAPDEEAFVRAVEEHFRRLRGSPLLLSPEDFQRVVTWRGEGIPLHLVLDTLTEVFQRAAERKPRRGPMTLAYCEPAIREAFDDYRERQVGASSGSAPAAPSWPELIEQAADAVEASRAPFEARFAASADLRALADKPRAGGPEDPVGEIARRLSEACRAVLAPDERVALERTAQDEIAAYVSDMSPEVRRRAYDIALARALRRRFALPDLSLLPPFRPR